MDAQISALYRLPNIEKYEDIHFLTLSENCAVLGEQVYAIASVRNSLASFGGHPGTGVPTRKSPRLPGGDS